MSRIFFTSDTHYGHSKIIKYSNRPFKHADEMDEHMIRVWNEKVSDDDHVYHLGDLSFHDKNRTNAILNQLKGRIYFIRGNHDQVVDDNPNHVLQLRFEWVKDYYELFVDDPDGFKGKQVIVLSHFPFMSWHWMNGGSWHLHGHCHHNLRYPFKGRILDTGVDGKGYCYAPISYEEVKGLMQQVETPQYLDHHSDS